MSTAKEKRLQAKKRKLEAFLNVAKLNDEEGRNRESLCKISKQSETLRKAEGNDALETLRKRLRERQSKIAPRLSLELKTKGHDASLDIPSDLRKPLLMRNIQSFLLHCLFGQEIAGSFRWFRFEEIQLLKRVQCLIFDGLNMKDFLKCDRSFKRIFSHQLEVTSPSCYDSCIAEDFSMISSTSIRANAPKGLKNIFNIEEESSDNNEDDIKLKLMLDLPQMCEENYPLPIKGPMMQKCSGYVFSQKSYKSVTSASPMLAIDCEMCFTSIGKLELTKVCVVDSHLNKIYESLVKPSNKIIDYKTQFSGITAETLKNVTKTLKQVQEELLQILPPNAIWVGQSLNSDLHALQIFHPFVIDTSVIYNISGYAKHKTSLKTLSHIFLGETIQDDSSGHDPFEDAMAAMKLVNLKVQKGLDFGDAIHDNVNLQDIVPSRSTTPIFKEEEKVKKICVVATPAICQSYRGYWLQPENITLVEAVDSESALNCSSQDNDLLLCHIETKGINEAEKLAKVQKWTEKMWIQTPEKGLFLTIWTGSKKQGAFVGIALKKAGH